MHGNYGRTTKRLVRYALCAAMTATALSDLRADEQSLDWPQEIDAPAGKIIVYQPQPESFTGNRLSFRVAVAVTLKGATEPDFGAVWFESSVTIDREARTVVVQDCTVTKVRFLDATAEQGKALSDHIGEHLANQCFVFSLDSLLTSIDLAEKEQVAADRLATIPPRILFNTTPAVLVVFDGKPMMQPSGNNPTVMRAMNTPFIVLFDTAGPAFYLKGGDAWLTAPDVMGPWRAAEKVPPAVQAAAPAGPAPASVPQPAPTVVPRVIVATEPTELIVSDGEPVWAPIGGARLLYMKNTWDDVFLDPAAKRYYVLLAGRWYRSASSGGPWTYVPADKLPPAFAGIPPDSPKGRVRAHVAGTGEARDAVLDAGIPQTASIPRSGAGPAVAYDGEPKFEKIEGTSMRYAANTDSSVIRAAGNYYCCDQAVWYTADSTAGPWAVCTVVPKEIYTIPPTCPLYNVRYAYVYGSTPEEVSVGYLPGYTGNYVYGGTVVYGTGYSYPGWTGSVYAPRPTTWGFDAEYDPAGGSWLYGSDWSYGDWVYGSGPGDWWGPGGYHYYTGGKTDGQGKADAGQKKGGGGTPGRHEHRDNIYARMEQPLRAKARAGAQAPRAPRVATGARNNVFADREGNIARMDDGWERYSKAGWAKSASYDVSREMGRQPGPPAITHRSELDLHYAARQRGAVRAQSFQRSAPMYGGGGVRGGGAAGRGGGGHGGGGGRGSGGGGGGGGGHR